MSAIIKKMRAHRTTFQYIKDQTFETYVRPYLTEAFASTFVGYRCPMRCHKSYPIADFENFRNVKNDSDLTALTIAA